MEKMLFFARILAVEIRKYNEPFFKGVSDFHYAFREMLRGTKLRITGNKYIEMDSLGEDSDIEEEGIWYISEDDRELADYADDEEDAKSLAGVLICSEFLYEVLYDFVMLGVDFKNEEMKEAAQALMKNLYKIADAFRLNVSFCNGRIYFRYNKQPMDDGSYVCKTMSEVEAVCKLKKGEGILAAMEASGMSDEEFESLMERLREHEWKLTSACEDEAFMEELRQRGWK